MTVPEEDLTRHLNFLLKSSEPGDTIDHLLVSAGPGGPFGLPDPEKLEVSCYAIAWQPGHGDDCATFTTKVLTMAGIDHVKKGMRIVFAGLAQERVAVVGADDLSRRLAREGRLEEHPRAGEVTTMYAACADGRRWHERRWLTGPKAGQTEPTELLAGPLYAAEQELHATLLRRLVQIGY